MKSYVVAIANTFHNTNKVYVVIAKNSEEAVKRALESAGWETVGYSSLQALLDSIADIVSEPVEI